MWIWNVAYFIQPWTCCPLVRFFHIESFFFVFDLNTTQVKEGESFEYYFEVYDNDDVNGSKKSQSRAFEFNAPTEEELQKQQEIKTKGLKKQLEENVQLAKELQEEFTANPVITIELHDTTQEQLKEWGYPEAKLLPIPT